MPLGERFTFKNGINASREAFRAEGIHCIGVSDVYKCLPITAENVIGTVAISDDEIEKNKVGYGDILFQRSSETKEDIGHASVYFDNTTSVYNGFVICAKPDELFYDPLYLHYSLQNTRVRKQTITLGAGSGQHYNIGQEGLAQIKAVFPCLEEQQRISDLVFSVDKVIAQSEAEVQNLEQQKKAAMQKIFSQEVRFKREDGTDFPEWEEKKLHQLVKPNDKVPVEISKYRKITIGLRLKGVSFAEMTREMADKRPFYLRKEGEIIVGKQNYFNGSIALITKEFNNTICSNAIMSFMPNDSVITFFLLSAISNDKYLKEREYMANGTGQKELSEKDFLNFSVAIPCLEEQQKIADFLSAYDEAISYAKQELDKWKELKKGLLQQMFV